MITDDQQAGANVDLLQSTFEAFNARDIATCLTRLSPDFIINVAGEPGPRYGHESWRSGVEIINNAFPDLRAEIEDIFGSGDRVAVRLTFRGTHQGDLEGIPATGRHVTYSSNEIYRVTDGLIAEEWICSDVASLFRQIS